MGKRFELTLAYNRADILSCTPCCRLLRLSLALLAVLLLCCCCWRSVLLRVEIASEGSCAYSTGTVGSAILR